VYISIPNGAVPEVPSDPRFSVAGDGGGVSFDFEQPVNKTNEAKRSAFTRIP
jgi:hypothetical protein